MKRPSHLAWALVAATLHLAAPVAAYANAGSPSWPNDLCTTVSSTAATPARDRTPLPASHEHHCAHAPCSAGGAIGASAPPLSSPTLLRTVVADVVPPIVNTIAAPIAPIVAAQPRGPPAQA